MKGKKITWGKPSGLDDTFQIIQYEFKCEGIQDFIKANKIISNQNKCSVALRDPRGSIRFLLIMGRNFCLKNVHLFVAKFDVLEIVHFERNIKRYFCYKQRKFSHFLAQPME